MQLYTISQLHKNQTLKRLIASAKPQMIWITWLDVTIVMTGFIQSVLEEKHFQLAKSGIAQHIENLRNSDVEHYSLRQNSLL